MKTLISLLKPYFRHPWFFKFAFNISPMYRRSTGRILSVSDDLRVVKVKIPLSYKNQNYAGSIFGGSLFSATDPILMIQLVQILGNDYIVWDKESRIKFKIPARKTVFADFKITKSDLDTIVDRVRLEKQIDFTKTVIIYDKKGNVFAEVTKTIYIADKKYHKEKMQKRRYTQYSDTHMMQKAS